ncbi:MAG: hypothetical protein M3279_00340 [Actinomycetota bacterium]|nr:hypothetical protein [Actinomycetota bacterium]
MIRRSRTRRLIALAAAVTAAASVVPVTVATPAAAASPCRAVPLGGPIQNSQPVLIAGAYTAKGAIDVVLTCGAVSDGVTVALVTDKMTGPVAEVHRVAHVSPGSITSCYELLVYYSTSPPTNYDTCP